MPHFRKRHLLADNVPKVIRDLTRLQDLHGMMDKTLADRSGYTAANFSDWRRGKKSPGFHALSDAAQVFKHELRLLPIEEGRFTLGDRVRKKGGSAWHGRIVGTYSTTLTPRGYNVESEREPGSVQLYPEAALEPYHG